MILIIDNYDSFTYNIVQYLGELGASVEVHRNVLRGENAGIAPKKPAQRRGTVRLPGGCRLRPSTLPARTRRGRSRERRPPPTGAEAPS